MHHSRSLHECFSEYMTRQFMSGRNGIAWRDYWLGKWQHEIEWYLSQKWHLMIAAHNKKDPLAGSHGCYDPPLSLGQAMDAVRDGHNLAVVMKDLVVIDWDAPDVLPCWLERTRTARTPKGWHFYCRGPFDKDLSKELRGKYEQVDVARSYPFFSLVPVSSSFLYKNDKRLPGPARVYEWVSEKPMMEFPDFVKEALV